MAVFCVRLPDDIAARFDAAAQADGGRSDMLRRLIAEASGGAPARRLTPAPRRDGARLMVRLTPADAGALAAEAGEMLMPPAAWVAALVRRRLTGRPAFGRRAELTFIAVQAELRRIGVNVNQIARALNTAVLEGRVLQAEMGAVDDLRRELRAHVAGLREAFEGNLAYWETDL